MPRTVLISAGEASGDLHAANLLKALQQMMPDVRARAMGGDKLRAAGAEMLFDCADLAVVGIVEVLLNYRRIKGVLNAMIEEIRHNPPDLLILVDYQEFNFRLARAAKQNGVKVLFYISPQVWAWRPHRVHKIGEIIDMMAVLFPFEEKFYRDAGVPVSFVGNPLVDEVRPMRSKAEDLQHFGLDESRRTIGLFPGSRKGEIKRVLPIQLKAAQLLRQRHPELQFILPIASTLKPEDIQPQLEAYAALGVHTVQDCPYDVMQVCDAIITASGTATLEIALMGVPNVITYRIAPLSYFILKRMVTIDHIGLANIVAEKEIVREFIQHEARPRAITDEVERLLDDITYRNTMISEMAGLREKLGKPGGSRNVAQLAFELLQD